MNSITTITIEYLLGEGLPLCEEMRFIKKQDQVKRTRAPKAVECGKLLSDHIYNQNFTMAHLVYEIY